MPGDGLPSGEHEVREDQTTLVPGEVTFVQDRPVGFGGDPAREEDLQRALLTNAFLAQILLFSCAFS